MCGNFGLSRGRAGKCTRAWHALCYVQDDRDRFPVLSVRDLDDALMDDTLMTEEEEGRFTRARPGDHLMTPFQCDWCLFWNLRGHFPDPSSHRDDRLMMCVRRAILDAFWSRESSTVRANLREATRLYGIHGGLGIQHLTFPRQGPHPTRDSWGVSVAVGLLVRSLDRGRNAQHVQFDTVRKIRSFAANYAHTTPSGFGPTFTGVTDLLNESLSQ